MNSTGRASAIIHTRRYRLGSVRITFIATCLGGFLGCTQDEASPQVPLDPPNRGGETADVDDDSAAVGEGGSDSGNDDTADNQGGSADDSSASQGGATDDTTESQGGSSESSTTTSRGGANASSTSKSTGTTPAAGSSCVQGVNTGSPCDPAIDTEVCERSTRTCTCGDDSTWTCTPKATGGMGGAASGS